MDFDPGFHEEMYDEIAEDNYEEGYEDAQVEMEETMEPAEEEGDLGGLGNPYWWTTAALFGYQMGQDKDRIDERQLASDILERRENNVEPEKVSLKTRHKIKGGEVSPARRAMLAVASGRKTTKDPIEYTDAEKKAILEYEGESDFEW